MTFFDYVFNYFQKLESSSKGSIIFFVISAFLPALTYIIYFDPMVFRDYDLFKLILFSVVINFQTILLLALLTSIPWMIIISLTSKFHKKLDNQTEKLKDRIVALSKSKYLDVDTASLNSQQADEATLRLKPSEFRFITYPLIIICVNYMLEIVILIIANSQIDVSATTMIGRYNEFSRSIWYKTLIYLSIDSFLPYIRVWRSGRKIEKQVKKFEKDYEKIKEEIENLNNEFTS